MLTCPPCTAQVLRYLLAFTDGGDNASTTEVRTRVQAVPAPALHATVTN